MFIHLINVIKIIAYNNYYNHNDNHYIMIIEIQIEIRRLNENNYRRIINNLNLNRQIHIYIIIIIY